ncbi:SPL family radical SAM protein [Vulcanisaeta distributa]|uniref:Radical SAM domain protein n=1 Tax=Vulcanisaeta distributa (strain DSM 14429 / JCM 11212 / NBRC 100878 / IC-017) TaxID=572478 RepID=E1QRZ5_VULDI|nr:radical SAM protein [Vulcanisaeta distributa]ADN50712.1 Radical SAM domain protein [Vulcanisaeta distributa DSM 14429]
MNNIIKLGNTIVREIRVKTALSRSGLPEYDYALNPYLGCQHGCVYCYAMDFTKGEPGIKWGEVVYVKVNLIQALLRDIRRFKPGIVGVSTITDPYQPVESRYKLTRRAIEVLCNAGYHVSIQTKSALIIRDLDVINKCSKSIDVGFTITTMRNTYRIIEPMAAHPMARASALRKIASLGIETWIFLGPLIPGINDKVEDYESVIRLAKETNSQVIIDRFRPRSVVIKFMSRRLSPIYPVTRDWWIKTLNSIMKICRDYGVNCITAEDEWEASRKMR